MEDAVYAPGVYESLGFEPIFARCLIERVVTDKIGSIYIPTDKAKQHAVTGGRLIACGANCEKKIKEIVGKNITFAKFAGDWIKIKEREVFIIQEDDILGVEHV